MLSGILQCLSAILVMIAVPLVAHPRIEGLYVMFFAQAGWFAFALLNHQYWFVLQSGFLLVFNVIGVFNWRRKGIGCPRPRSIEIT